MSLKDRSRPSLNDLGRAVERAVVVRMVVLGRSGNARPGRRPRRTRRRPPSARRACCAASRTLKVPSNSTSSAVARLGGALGDAERRLWNTTSMPSHQRAHHGARSRMSPSTSVTRGSRSAAARFAGVPRDKLSRMTISPRRVLSSSRSIDVRADQAGAAGHQMRRAVRCSRRLAPPAPDCCVRGGCIAPADDPRRHAGDDGERRHVVGHDRAGADDAPWPTVTPGRTTALTPMSAQAPIRTGLIVEVGLDDRHVDRHRRCASSRAPSRPAPSRRTRSMTRSRASK